jgi:SAM-dependent methyltransferase
MRLVSDYVSSMPDDRRPRLRLKFDEVPELYERARPAYPPQLFDDLAELLPPDAHIVEVGCGTGNATVPLAERGYRLTCVELGARLATVARRNLAGFPAVDVVVADFETWKPPSGLYDAVLAFTAFHWIDPEVRYRRAAGVLRMGGLLAVTNVKHVLPEDGDPFFVEVQRDYRAVVPDEDDGSPPPPDDVPDLADEIAASGRFERVASLRYVWDVSYTAEEYIDVLDTYSGHRDLEPATRARLYGRIRNRIGDRTVRKTYLATLDAARRI